MESSFKIHIIGEKLFSNSQKAITLQNLKKLGELKESKIFYSPFEAMYLVKTKKAELLKNNKSLSETGLIKLFSKKDKNFPINYAVFKELRKKGYIVKTGLKFGAEFRVYEKNKLFHAKYICYPIKADKLDLKELISKTRIAHSTAKKLLLAIVDSEENVLFYEIDWVKL